MDVEVSISQDLNKMSTESNTVENTEEKSEGFKIPDIVPSRTTTNTKENHLKNTELIINQNDTNKPPNNFSKLSPAEQLKELNTAIPYKEPSWGGVSEQNYTLEVLKNGMIIDTMNLNKSFFVFGRLPSCDVTLEHPSLSRHHAVIQFCRMNTENQTIGWYLYDLDSTHGTWINKNRVFSKKYYRLRVGHVLKFGGSSRLYILQGPEEDREEESDMSVSELKEQRERQKKEAEVLRMADLAAHEQKLEAIKKKEEDTGCSWGMGDDAMEEDSGNPFSEELKLENEELYLDDPKKALKGFYEREGYEEPEYIVTDAGNNKYKCAVELPVDGPNGEPVIAEAIVSGKKKEAVLQCALEGCRILDRMNLLRASTHESRKRKLKNWEDDDFYDSDEDLYLDRTGDIEKKRQQRMKKAGKIEEKTETYQTLMEKHETLLKEIQGIEEKLEKAKSDAAAMDSDGVDALDAYMMAIKSGVMDTKTKMALKRQLIELKQEEAKVRKLVNIAKPASLPELKSPQISQKPQIPSIGKLPGFGKIKQKIQKRPVVMTKPLKAKEKEENFEEEEEEDEEEPPKKQGPEDPASRLQPEDPSSRLKPEDSTNRPKSEDPSSRLQSDIPSSNSKQSHTDTSTESIKSTTTVNPARHKQKQNRAPQKPPINTEGKIKGDYDSTDPDYAVWMPPSGRLQGTMIALILTMQCGCHLQDRQETEEQV